MHSIASLSDQGWVSDPRTVLNYVVTCYMLSDAAQSLTFQGNIKSLSETYYKHINNPDNMAAAMSSELNTTLTHYFAHVDVSARAKEVSGKHYAIVLKVMVMTDDGERLDLAKVMEIDSQSLRKIIEINNYGDARDILSNF